MTGVNDPGGICGTVERWTPPDGDRWKVRTRWADQLSDREEESDA